MNGVKNMTNRDELEVKNLRGGRSLVNRSSIIKPKKDNFNSHKDLHNAPTMNDIGGSYDDNLSQNDLEELVKLPTSIYRN